MEFYLSELRRSSAERFFWLRGGVKTKIESLWLFIQSFIFVLLLAWTIRACKRQNSLTNYQSKLLLIFSSWLSTILLLAFILSFGWKGGGAIAALTVICTMILIAATLVTLIISKIPRGSESEVS